MPVALISLSPISRSMTSKAPILLVESTFTALASSFTTDRASSSSNVTAGARNLPWPKCSKARLSSGWNTMGKATNSKVTAFCKSQEITCSSSQLQSIVTPSNTKTPFTRVMARVS